jgi:hypothetical protein
MIRRDDRADWLIIPQIEHARLAGELALAWGNERVRSLAEFPKLLWGVAHHDDGWREWDEVPRLKPETGFPRNFIEMRMRDSTAIWTKSIAICSADPLAGIAVSRHFCYLSRQVQSSGHADADDRAALDQFLIEQGGVEASLSNRARSQYPSSGSDENLEQLYDFGFRTVRFFDSVSLWLCCSEEQHAESLTTPLGEAIRLIPQAAGFIAIDPYPLGVDSLLLKTPVRRLAARRYGSDAELQAALQTAPLETLAWTIRPV